VTEKGENQWEAFRDIQVVGQRAGRVKVVGIITLKIWAVNFLRNGPIECQQQEIFASNQDHDEIKAARHHQASFL